jgi:pyrimidine operon attenuation protein/uracil phosphoribosyltransferase
MVELAVLVDRGSRRLPVSADFAGIALAAAQDEDVVVSLHDDPSRDRIDIRPRAARAERAASIR